jgi:hypothetical protein
LRFYNDASDPSQAIGEQAMHPVSASHRLVRRKPLYDGRLRDTRLFASPFCKAHGAGDERRWNRDVPKSLIGRAFA